MTTLRRAALALALCAAPAACRGPRAPRPTLLNLPPPLPPPEANEARLMPVDLRPDAPDAPETPPGSSLESMAHRALDAAQTDLVRCYESLLVAHPDAEGRVEVQLDLSPRGVVTRAHLDHDGDDIAPMMTCLRDVLSAVQVHDVSPRGRYVSRVYTFRNPPIDRVVYAAVDVTAPPPPRRARGRRGAPANASAEAPTAAVPEAAPGSLRADELTRGLTGLAPLRACAGLALRRGRRGEPTGALSLSIGADGRVTGSRFERRPPWPAPVETCVETAVGALRYRPTGIVVHAKVPLRFVAAPR